MGIFFYYYSVLLILYLELRFLKILYHTWKKQSRTPCELQQVMFICFNYPKYILVYPNTYWCMRFEAKHSYFKSLDSKNIMLIHPPEWLWRYISYYECIMQISDSVGKCGACKQKRPIQMIKSLLIKPTDWNWLCPGNKYIVLISLCCSDMVHPIHIGVCVLKQSIVILNLLIQKIKCLKILLQHWLSIIRT